MARVLPDRPGINKVFDYEIPPELDARASLGAMVRVELHGRRIGGWIVGEDRDPPAGLALKPLAKVSSLGPTAEILELAEWAAWRWAGVPAHFLRTASPERNVTALGPLEAARAAGGPGAVVVRLPPAASPYELVAEQARPGALVLVPSLVTAHRLASKLRRDGVVDAAVYPDDWARVRSGACTIGTRSGAWAPLPALRSVILVDEHDEVWQQESAPTWHARDVIVERARRADAACTLVSPAPTLEALGWAELRALSRDEERAGWPVVNVVDRRDEPPGAPLLSEALAAVLRTDARVVCVLNRKGRSRLSACANCGELARCERCHAAVSQNDDGDLVCGTCGAVRPLVCLACGGGRFRNLRAGVARVREELEALARTPVVEVTGDTHDELLSGARVFVGTEAVLHRVPRADVVAFLEFDQELMAPRYRAAEEALTLLIRAARLVGGRAGGGRILVHTRLPRHETIQAALHGDPERLVARERTRRELLHYPPYAAVAVVSGAVAPAFVASFGRPLGVDVLGPTDGAWLLRAATHGPLLDALAATPRPSGRLRIAVDPLRL